MKKMNVLIIDDDITIVDAIESSVDWDRLMVEQVCKAYNIEDAKQILDRQEIELIISDIEMPQGSGLELLKWYREQELDGEFLLLTCHENFEYAANALKMQAAEYILKPFDAEVLEMALQKCIQNIRKKEANRKSREYEAWFQHNYKNIKLSFVERLLKEPFTLKMYGDNSKLISGGQKLELGTEYRILAAKFTDMEKDTAKYGRELLKFVLNNLFSEILCSTPENERVICQEKDDELLLAAVCDVDSDETMLDRARILVDSVRQYIDCVMTVCVSRVCDVSQLFETYHRILKKMSWNVGIYGKVVLESQISEKQRTGDALLDGGKLKEYLDKKDKSGLLNYLKRCTALMHEPGNLDREMLIKVKQELLQANYFYLTERGIQASRLLGDQLSVDMEKKAVRSVLDLMRWAAYLLERTFAYEEEIRKSNTMIGQINDYIHKHYGEEIGRNEIAEHFFLTPEYLAKMYKRKTGTSLKDYLNEYRIGQAKRLLAQTDKLVSDVAIEVGMDNFSYFSTLFRKYTGLTPNEYRKRESGV